MDRINCNQIKEGQFLLMECRGVSARYFEIVKVLNENGEIQIISNDADIKNIRDIPSGFVLKSYVSIIKIEKNAGWNKKGTDKNTDIVGFYPIEQQTLKEMALKKMSEKIEQIEKYEKEANKFKQTMKEIGLL
ncbi:MAG: hypothetical protein WC872_00730 [Candidatus Absconditabacterales bacterium]|jgi:hypothetical protein